jgi:hypothetical protein
MTGRKRVAYRTLIHLLFGNYALFFLQDSNKTRIIELANAMFGRVAIELAIGYCYAVLERLFNKS